MQSRIRFTAGLALALCSFVGYLSAQAPQQAVATATVSPSGLFLQANASARGWKLTVTGPEGFVFTSEGVQPPAFTLADGQGPLADGVYQYELRPIASPLASESVVSAAEESGDGRASSGRGAVAALAPMSGSFRVSGGVMVVPSLQPESSSPVRNGRSAVVPPRPLDQTITDDLIVQGSGCFGFDCVTNEDFGFDTIKLKENNLRIKFDDTSVNGFPATDWQLTANDSGQGGLNKFSIEDVTAGKVPFTILGGAPTNSLVVDASGKIGLRTATPLLSFHAASSDTPALRLEQDGLGGYTPQTWDIGANEANFFIRDVTGGSRLSFRIRPGAPTSSIDIAASGRVGIGTASPDANLDVEGPGAADVTMRLSRRDVGSWDFRNNAGTGRLTLSDDPTGIRIPIKFGTNAVNNLFRVGAVDANTVDIAGNLIVNGTFSNPSSRELKDLISPAADVLTKLSDLKMFTWAYKNDAVRHFGPVAEDFFARWGLGLDEKHISPNDMAGVALAASQELHVLLKDKDAEIQSLKDRLARLEALLGVTAEKKTEIIKK